MVEVPIGLSLSYIVNEARNLFRKCVWLQVGSQLKHRQKNVTVEDEGMSYLKICNWNLVQNSKTCIMNQADITAPALVHHPFAVVMIWIPIEETEENGGFSNDFVEKCIRSGQIYESIHENTQLRPVV